MTWYDHLIELDPGTFKVRATAEYRTRPPQKIAVLPFTDTGSGDYVLDKVPVTVRTRKDLADWRWTDSNRLRKVFDGYLAEREFTTINPYEIDAILAAHGIDDDVKLSRVTPQELGRWLGADAVVYGEVKHYEVYYAFLIAGWRVRLQVRMVSTKTGCPLLEAAGTRFKNQVMPAVAWRDILINSAIETTDLRDVDLRRAEEEAAREIMLRIPYATETGLPPEPPTPVIVAANPVDPPPEASEKAVPTSEISPQRSGAWQVIPPSDPQEPLTKPVSMSAAAGPSAQSANDASQFAPSTSQVAKVSLLAASAPSDQPAQATIRAQQSAINLNSLKISTAALEPLNDPNSPGVLEIQGNPASSVLVCSGAAISHEDKTDTGKTLPPEQFFLPERRDLSHGRKTVLDRMIETDPETYPMQVDQQYYEDPPTRIAVLPFEYGGSGNLLVDKLVPITFHLAQEREKWRGTVANRLRRTFTAFLAQRGEFEIVPLPEINAVLQAHGVKTYNDLLHVSAWQLGRWLHVDAVVYGEVTKYEGYYVSLIAGWTVGLDVRMVSTVNGRELIRAESGRWHMIIEPALAVPDLLIYSGLQLAQALRDIRLIRAEEETCREIVLRIPELPEHVRSLQSVAVRNQQRAENSAQSWLQRTTR
jgi:hypothetical protein